MTTIPMTVITEVITWCVAVGCFIKITKGETCELVICFLP
ncbi:hypothetical protein CGLO_18167 [Colletotrichum gloeosporioides Cg-14]|uniref:Uncharacterized protein n=1 Tax=Colletotrichum gloeosporioides (strain Cg-14) TaxID=1237896 RepID=T0JV09_COLGC|nr:hypothetical protein CGLO_18167 [Colletotrichum gloeosporioides Cg-14]